MNLRLYRTFHWTHADVPLSEMRIGGPPAPLVLAHRDELQMQTPEGEWVPVPVVEGPVPENPQDRARRERDEAMQADLQRMFQENPELLTPVRLRSFVRAPGAHAGKAPDGSD